MISDRLPHSQDDTFASPDQRRRYYFDVHDGQNATTDDEGLDLESDHAAQQEAVRALPEVAKDALPDGTEREFSIVVRDEARGPILKARLSLIVETIPKP